MLSLQVGAGFGRHEIAPQIARAGVQITPA